MLLSRTYATRDGRIRRNDGAWKIMILFLFPLFGITMTNDDDDDVILLYRSCSIDDDDNY